MSHDRNDKQPGCSGRAARPRPCRRRARSGQCAGAGAAYRRRACACRRTRQSRCAAARAAREASARNPAARPAPARRGGGWFAPRTDEAVMAGAGPSPDDRLAGEIVDGHMRSLMAAQPTDVASSDRHTVKPWFAGRVPQAPRVIDLTQDGFPLIGGRIDVIGGTPVPTLVYRHRQHLISLSALPGAGAPAPRAVKGYNLVGWSADGVAYWAVSDLGAGDLEKFARLFRLAPTDPEPQVARSGPEG